MTRSTRVASFVLLGVAIGLLIGLIAFYVLTKTEFGLERVRTFTVGWVGDQFQGKLRIGEVTTEGLLGGVTLHRVEIDDPDGKAFLRSDSIRLAYKWRTLLGGRIVFDRVDLYNPSVYLTRLPGDSLWNFEYAFRDTTPKDPGTGADRLVMLEDLFIHDALAEVRMPIDPDEPRDTARMIIEQRPAGLLRVMRAENVDARLPRVLWESPAEPGKLFNIRSLSGQAWLYRTPMQVSDLRGTIALRDSLLSFDVSRVKFPHTELKAVGQVLILDTLEYNVEMSSGNLDFRDFGWLYPDLPESGGGRLAFRIQTQPDGGTLWLVENARLRAPGTNVAGSFGIVTGDSLYFTRVDLRAAPLDVDVVERMLPQKLPIDGLLIGTVRVTGPISALESSGNLRLAGSSAAAGSAVRWAGTMDFSNGHFIPRHMRADVERLNLELLRALRPDMRAEGRVSGHLEATGDVARGLRFAANVSHVLPGQVASTLSGRGLWRAAGSRGPGTFEARFDSTSVDLATLAGHFPALEGFAGRVHGTVKLAGPTNALGVDADVTTPGGRVQILGALDLDAPAPSFDLITSFTDFRLDHLVQEIPLTTLSGNLRISGHAQAAAGADVRGSATITSGTVGNVPVTGATAGFALRDGLLTLDSMRLRTAAGSVSAAGTFGIVPGARGALQLSLALDTVAALAPLFFDEDAVPGDSLSLNGALRGEVELSGNTSSFNLSGLAEVQRGAWRGHTAKRTQFAIVAKAVRTPAVTAHAEALLSAGSVAGRPIDSLRVDVRVAEGAAGFAAHAHLPDHSFALAGDVRRDGERADARVHRFAAQARGSEWALADTATISIAPDAMTLSSLEFRRAGTAAKVGASGTLVWGGGSGESDFTFSLAQVPAAEWLPLIAPRVDAEGAVDARVHVAGPSAAPRINAALRTARITYGGAPLGRVAGEVSYADRMLTIEMEAQSSGRTVLNAHGQIPYDLRLQQTSERRLGEPLRLTIDADSMPAALPLSFFRGYANTAGSLNGAIEIGGTTLDPTLGGTMSLAGGATDIEAAGTRIENARANFRLHDDRTVEIEGTFTAGVGGGSVVGSLKFDRLQDPQLGISITAREMDAARRRDVEVVASGTVRLAGRFASPRLAGNLRLDRGAMHLDEIWREYQVVGLESPLLFDVVDTTRVAIRHIMLSVQSPFMRNLVIDGSIDVGRDFWLRSRDLNVEVGGELQVAFNRQARDLRLNGTLAATRGSYQLFGRRFQVRDGAVEFHGTPGINPNMEITAEYRARTVQGDPLDIQAVVTGSLLSPRVRLVSTAEPPISESDLASYLLFGRPTYALAAGEAQALSLANAENLTADLVAPSLLGLGARALENVGQQFGLDYVAITSGEVERQQGDAPGFAEVFQQTFASSQLEVGRYLGDDLFLALSRRIAGGGTDAYGARLEWQLGPILTGELFLEDRFLRQPAFGLDPALTSNKVYGLFLFREWTF